MFYLKELFGVCLILCAVAGSSQVYTLTDLGDLPGGNYSARANAINDRGWVIGTSNGEFGRRPFLWRNGTMQDLGALNGSVPEVGGINESGQIVGRYGSQAFVWTPEMGMQHLTHPFDAWAMGNNDRDQVVGWCDGHAAIWNGGSYSTLDGTYVSIANAINDLGIAIGDVGSPDSQTAALWAPGQPRLSLGDLPGGTFDSHAADINDLEQVVGTGNAATGHRAFLWTRAAGMRDLGDLPTGSDSSGAAAINELGVIVGSSNTSSGQNAFIWTEGQGMVSLYSLTDSSRTGWKFSGASDINIHGQIVGTGIKDGSSHAFLLTPVPEPTTILALCIGFGLACRRRWTN